MIVEQRYQGTDARARTQFGINLRIKSARDGLMTPEERARARELRDIQETLRDERGIQLLEQQQRRGGTIVDFRGTAPVTQSGTVLIGG